MKTLYVHIAMILILAFTAVSFKAESHQKKSILIESAGAGISPEILSQSADIIKKRLSDFSADEFTVTVIPGKKQIKVVTPDTSDLKIIEDLIVQRGIIEFYETWDHAGLAGLLNGDEHLFTLLNETQNYNSVSRIGCIKASQASVVTDYLKTLDLGGKCIFAWSWDPYRTDMCLYALKLSDGKGPLITNRDIAGAKYNQDMIGIKIKDQAVGLWAEATKRNLNHDIAIVMDNKVISAPKVMSEIKSGEIEISGTYSKMQAAYIASVINNGALPAVFVAVK